MKILGVKPRFFRPVRPPLSSASRVLTLATQPFGSYSDASLKVLESRGYYTTLWTHDSEDTLGATPAQSVAGFRALYADFPAPVMSLSHGSSSLSNLTNPCSSLCRGQTGDIYHCRPHRRSGAHQGWIQVSLRSFAGFGRALTLSQAGHCC